MVRTNDQVIQRISMDLYKILGTIKKQNKCSWADASVILAKRLEKYKIEMRKLQIREDKKEWGLKL